MKKVIYPAIFAILFCCLVSEMRAEPLKVGAKFASRKIIAGGDETGG